MRIVIDIETNELSTQPKHIWCIVCKDIDTLEYHIFRDVTGDEHERERFLEYFERLGTEPNSLLIGHNLLAFDYPVLNTVLKLRSQIPITSCIDTLIISKLADYSREGGHSIERYGIELGSVKIAFSDFSKWSQEMEDYCVRDTDICHRVYLLYEHIVTDRKWYPSILLEHEFQLVLNDMHAKGFAFDTKKAEKLLGKVKGELDVLDKEIEEAFPPRVKRGREVHPKLTKYGSLNRTDFRFCKDGDLSIYNGGSFTRITYEPFNPSSHKQIVDVLHSAGWSPADKTTTHIEAERELGRLKYQDAEEIDLRLEIINAKLISLKKYGFRVNENNLNSLPPRAPKAARLLARRILLESRRRTLVEWLTLVEADDRVHGEFYGIGAWTHRMAHQKPNLANIPNATKEDGSPRLLGKELRSLWIAPKNRLLVGVDAEGIQLRVFAHYIDDKEFTDAIVQGKKSDKTDPHSLNQRVLGNVCKSRQAAKRFIYALLLGAGISKLSSVLECSESDTKKALDRLLERYTGFARLKETTIPKDAKSGYFRGLDGRRVVVPGDYSERRHLMMSGYLQNGEAVIMKAATILFYNKLKDYDSYLLNLIHDEWQTETPNNLETALAVARLKADSLAHAGVKYNLRCPLTGSYWSDTHNDYSIGVNWYQTH